MNEDNRQWNWCANTIHIQILRFSSPVSRLNLRRRVIAAPCSPLGDILGDSESGAGI